LRVTGIRTEALGNSSYLLTHNGIGILVDLQRDIDRFERLIEADDIEPRLVLDTHLHNDYISGGPALSKKTGAELVVPAAAAPVYRHRPAFHMEDIQVGDDLVIRPLHTPGHTPEHISYLVLLRGGEVQATALEGHVGKAAHEAHLVHVLLAAFVRGLHHQLSGEAETATDLLGHQLIEGDCRDIRPQIGSEPQAVETRSSLAFPRRAVQHSPIIGCRNRLRPGEHRFPATDRPG